MSLYTNLTQIERDFLWKYLSEGKSKKEIWALLWRDPTTIRREIKRNSMCVWKARWKYTKTVYLPSKAHEKAQKRKSNAWKHGNVLKNYSIRDKVIELLRKWYSPQIVSGVLDKQWFSISYETIYSFIYNQDYQHLKLWEYLPSHRKNRKHRKFHTKKFSLKDIATARNIPHRVWIEDREESINWRLVFGHWESDSVVWPKRTSYVLHVSVERLSRYTRIKKTKRWSVATAQAMIEIWECYPKEARKSTTPDNGSEFTKRELVKDKLGIDFYFTRPYCSWDKWTVERINGFIRRFFGKKTDFENITDEEIQKVEDWINNRPMKVLNYETPQKVFEEHIQKCYII